MGLALLAGLAVWLVVFAVGLSSLTERHDQNVLYAQLREQIALQTAPVGAPIARGAPVAVLNGPHLGRLVVVEGTSAAELRSGPGLYPATSLPGQPGITTILGRSTTYGGPFGSIHRLQVGDRIVATTGQGTYSYRVVGQALSGGQIPPAYITATSRLQLETAADSGFLGIPTPGRTRYVYAVLVGTPGGAGGVQTPTAPDNPNAINTAGLYPLVLWLQLLLIVGLAVVYGYIRTAARFRAHMWLLATPVALAGLWGASNSLFGVLPNLL